MYVPTLQKSICQHCKNLFANISKIYLPTFQNVFPDISVSVVGKAGEVEASIMAEDEKGMKTGSLVGIIVSFVLVFIAGLVVGLLVCRR